MKHEVKLNVSGDRAIAFMGEELINDTTKDTNKATGTRWHRLQVYITDVIDPVTRKVITPDGLYMIGVGFITCWKKTERDKYWVEEVSRGTVAADNAREVVQAFQKHIPPGPEPSDTPEEAKAKQEVIDAYLELVTWIGNELQTDAREKQNEPPGEWSPGNKTSLRPA